MKANALLLKYRRILIVMVHVALVTAAFIMAFYFRFDFGIPGRYLPVIWKLLPVLVPVKMIIFHHFGLYSGLWRYVSMDDVWRVLKANTFSTVVSIAYAVFAVGLVGFPRSVFILDWILCVGLMVGCRFLSRSFRERVRPVVKQKSRNALVIGAGEAGISVVRDRYPTRPR